MLLEGGSKRQQH